MDSSLHQTSCHWFSIQLLCNLPNLSPFFLFSFLKNVFWQPFYLSTKIISDNASLNSRWINWSISPVLCQICSYFLRTWLSDTIHLGFFWPVTSFPLYLSSFLRFFKDTLHPMLGYGKFLAVSILGTSLLVQKYYFMHAELCYLQHILYIQLRKKWKQIMCFCDKLWRNGFKIDYLLNCLWCLLVT